MFFNTYKHFPLHPMPKISPMYINKVYSLFSALLLSILKKERHTKKQTKIKKNTQTYLLV